MKQLQIFVPVLCSALLLLSISACNEAVQESLKPVPNAFGRVNQVTVIADKEMWEGPVGDTLRDYYGSPFIIVPQPEPMFDLWYFDMEALMGDRTRREMRHYIVLCNLSDANSPTTQFVLKDIGEEKARRAKEDPSYHTIIAKDKWAKGQIFVYQFAHSDDALVANIKKGFSAIAKRFNESDKVKIEASVFLDGENRRLMDAVRAKMGVSMRIPGDYFMAMDNEEIVWLRKENQKVSSNVMLKKIKYTDQSQLSKENMKAIRDSIGRKYVSSTLPNMRTYMRINDKDLPMFVYPKTLSNNYALEARGIWEMENDYMGGSFISYLVHNPNKNELIFVDGFVYAPGQDKRDFMQHLEYIISSLKF